MKYLNNSVYLHAGEKSSNKVITWDSKSKGEVYCEQGQLSA